MKFGRYKSRTKNGKIDKRGGMIRSMSFRKNLPGHPWNTLPEGYLSWAEIYILDNSNPGDPLPYCGIYNEAAEAGWGS